MKRTMHIGSSYKGALRLNRTEHRFRNSESESGNPPSEIDDIDDIDDKSDKKGS